MTEEHPPNEFVWGFSRKEFLLLSFQIIVGTLIIAHQFYPGIVEKQSPIHEPSPDHCLDGESLHSPELIKINASETFEVTNNDRDKDGISDAKEAEIGTSPIVSDTDGDGFLDGVEIRARETFPSLYGDIDPLRKDIFVEVDSTKGTNGLSDKEKKELTHAFAEAPVINPGSSNGIKLHLLSDSASDCVPDSQSIEDYIIHYQQNEFDYNGYGFYHVMIVEEVKNKALFGNTLGITREGSHGAIVQEQSGVGTGTSTMHELGHMLGIEPSMYYGIDGKEATPEEYNSVMNYNHSQRYFVFAGKDSEFDDWHVIENRQKHPPTHELEALVLP